MHDLTPGVWRDEGLVNYHDYVVRVHDNLDVTWIGKSYKGTRVHRDKWGGTRSAGWVLVAPKLNDPHAETDF